LLRRYDDLHNSKKENPVKGFLRGIPLLEKRVGN
jgi:hypothetical protein